MPNRRQEKLRPLEPIPTRAVSLRDIDPAATPGTADREEAERFFETEREALAPLQERLYAEGTRSLLIVLQGMDTAGKDGVVRHVITGMNPLGCRAVSFKRPTEEELGHDFLWRIHQKCPGKGEVVTFNRSHYEDVLAVRVRKIAPEPVWKARYELINNFEALLVHGGTTIIKIFLHISKEEQKERLLARLDDPDKNWKFDPGDVDDRKLWDEYQRAYEDLLEKTNTPHAPWYIVPADRKWYRNWATASIFRRTLDGMNPKPPKGKLKPADFDF